MNMITIKPPEGAMNHFKECVREAFRDFQRGPHAEPSAASVTFHSLGVRVEDNRRYRRPDREVLHDVVRELHRGRMGPEDVAAAIVLFSELLAAETVPSLLPMLPKHVEIVGIDVEDAREKAEIRRLSLPELATVMGRQVEVVEGWLNRGCPRHEGSDGTPYFEVPSVVRWLGRS